MDDRELNESLRRLPEVRPGDAFTAEVLARVERFERRRQTAGRGGAAARWRPTLLAAGLAAALVAAVGLWQPRGGGRSLEGGGEDTAAAATGAERPDEGSGGVPGGAEGGAAVTPPPKLGGMDRAGTSGDRRELGERLAARDGANSPQRSASPPTPLAEGVARESFPPADALATGPAPDALAGDTPAADPGADFFAAPPAGRPAAAAAFAEAVPAAASAAERLARLREERDLLERGLAAFRSAVPPAEPPVVVLDGGEGLDLVFDLGRWAAQPPAETPGAARPAVHSTQAPPRRF